ncbi:MAG: radical SAM protein [Clostridia bacterium]|nr:radical SAM protein [Clostridia bacterium]MBQ8371771.1 radical SAM protein [Clostridia bacterium]
MTLTYEVDGALYVNITNRCSNRCEFCIRNNDDGAYGSDSLWLEREPTAEEVLASILSRDLDTYRELVFCGYGEPSYRLADCRRIALAVKEKHPAMPVRINTNGQSDLILGENTAPMYEGAFDTVSVSLNTPSAEKYAQICHPVYGLDAFDAMLAFTKNVKNYVHNVVLSVVRESLSEEELAECLRIAEECGVELRVRTYIPPVQRGV